MPPLRRSAPEAAYGPELLEADPGEPAAATDEPGFARPERADLHGEPAIAPAGSEPAPWEQDDPAPLEGPELSLRPDDEAAGPETEMAHDLAAAQAPASIYDVEHASFNPEDGAMEHAMTQPGTPGESGAQPNLPWAATDADHAFDQHPQPPEPEGTRVELQPARDEDPWQAVDETEAPPPPEALRGEASDPGNPGDGGDEDPWESVSEAERETGDSEVAPHLRVLPSQTADPPDGEDPWAAFLATREGDGSGPFASPATATSGAAVSWDSASAPAPEFDDNHAADEPHDEEPATDDPWAAIAAASGYDAAAPGGIAVYRGPASGDGPIRNRFAASALAFDSGNPDGADGWSQERLSGGPDLSEPAPSGPAAWELDNDEDIVLRAFEAHAASEVGETPQLDLELLAEDMSDSAAFEPLLGKGAAGLLDEVSPRDPGSAALPGWQPPALPGSAPRPAEREEGWSEGAGEGDGAPPACARRARLRRRRAGQRAGRRPLPQPHPRARARGDRPARDPRLPCRPRQLPELQGRWHLDVPDAGQRPVPYRE